MRARKSTGGVTVQAVAGNHAVFFGLDLTDAARKDCLGFAVHRTDHTENEQYWISSFKTFRSVVPHPDSTSIYSTRDHPLQTFSWGDYTAKPDHEYTYEFVPRYGTPKNLVDRAGKRVTIDVKTSNPETGTHGIYFNRGVAASQAYAAKFGKPPDKLPPDLRAQALTWLSRGLFEAILAYIGQAKSAGFALRAAVYEFTQPDVLKAFQAARAAGADVQIVYHASKDDTGNGNRKWIKKTGIDQAMLIPRTNAPIAHNKFIVLCRRSAAGKLTPVSVWTGSTNLSEGGIFGHSNVGHAVRDPGVAAQYLDYWTELAGNPETDALRTWSTQHSPFDPQTAGTAGIQTIFSPRSGVAPLDWYADRFATSPTAGFITLAFGMTKTIEDALEQHDRDAIHYVMLNMKDSNQDVWSKSFKVFLAVGSKGGPDSLSRWASETLTNFNPRVPYLHTKILLRDPLWASPLVVTGSANYSPGSTNANDENMLVIPGDPEVADVYFTEYARIFNHFYARYWAAQLAKDGDSDVHSFLDETPAWQDAHYAAGKPKTMLRELYGSGIAGN
jgi:hypothetical protein